MENESNLQITDINDQEINRLLDELDNSDLEDASKFALKELIRSNNQDIFFKTELHMPQIESITKLRFLADIMRFQSKHYNTEDKRKAFKEQENIADNMTNLLMKLLVSKQRKGRSEFVAAWEGSQNREEGQKVFRKIFGGTGG